MNETLLGGEDGLDEEVRANPARSRHGYTPVQIPEEESRLDRHDSSGVSLGPARVGVGRKTSLVCIDGLDTVRQTNSTKGRKVVGTSLLVLPSIKSLKKCGWLQKRGHMVRYT